MILEICLSLSFLPNLEGCKNEFECVARLFVSFWNGLSGHNFTVGKIKEEKRGVVQFSD
jgi:hypothetical protein